MAPLPEGTDFAALLGFADAEQREEAVAIVDPYSSGRFLVEELRRRGWPLIAVRSALTIGEALLGTWNPALFERAVVHHGSVIETANALRTSRPLRAVIAGSEPGVELADALAEALGLRGNCAKRPRCRWDKYDMHQRLRECGLLACRQRLCSSGEEAAAFALELGAWPVVAKPRASHGGGDVHLCRDAAALAQAVEAIRASCDFAGRANDAALVQEFLEGTEYVVDCVSLDGRHLVAGTWAHSRTPTACGFAYDTTRALPYDGTVGGMQQRLYAYVFQCLAALGVQNGASHSEVVFSEAHGPCLVEVGARMHGSMGPALWAKCAGRDQAQPYLVADVFTEGGRELSKRLEAFQRGLPGYKLHCICMQVDLQCPSSGVLLQSVEASAGAWLRSLPTFSAMRVFVEEGDRVPATCDLFTSPGFVVLLGPSGADVERDAAAIRARERSGRMYVLQELSPKSQADGGPRRRSVTSARLRELEAEAEQLLSPLASRAGSPVLSPQQAPALPPGIDDLVEFTLDGAEDLDELGLGGFSLDEGLGEPGRPL